MIKNSFQVSRSLPTDLAKIIPFTRAIAEKILLLTGSEEQAFNIKLALEEALTNAMRHGNALRTALKVNVQIRADKTKIELDVHDEGAGFNYESLPDPTSAAFVDKPSGRGIFLMRNLMDELEFYDGGCGVKMIKYFAKQRI